ncbi:MAG: hypothetical protein KJ692_01095, partial [Verrucomicrobia bacterium]|nr:hypothetical protein [Verrucomicrobiota bacterium]
RRFSAHRPGAHATGMPKGLSSHAQHRRARKAFGPLGMRRRIRLAPPVRRRTKSQRIYETLH